jgi:hypothetical protein
MASRVALGNLPNLDLTLSAAAYWSFLAHLEEAR